MEREESTQVRELKKGLFKALLDMSLFKKGALSTVPVMAILVWSGTQLWDAFLDNVREQREAVSRIESNVRVLEADLKVLREQVERQNKESWFGLSKHRNKLGELEVQVGVVRGLVETTLIGKAVREPVGADSGLRVEPAAELLRRVDELEKPADPDDYRREIQQMQQQALPMKGN